MNEQRDQNNRRISDQGSLTGVFYGHSNEDGFSTNAKMGGINGKYTKARSTGGNGKSVKSGAGSGGAYGNNSHDANTSNKSYDEKILQI